jgi:hypothetical protein
MATMREVPLPTAPYEFLLALDAAIRPLVDAAEITLNASRLMGRYLKVSRCAYADVARDQQTFEVTCDYSDDAPKLASRHRLSEFGLEFMRLVRSGQPYIVEGARKTFWTTTVRRRFARPFAFRWSRPVIYTRSWPFTTNSRGVGGKKKSICCNWSQAVAGNRSSGLVFRTSCTS